MKYELKGLVLGANPEQAETWSRPLEEAGWDIEYLATTRSGALDLCQDYQVIIVVLSGGKSDIVSLLERCSERDAAAFLPVLSQASPKEVIELVRLGVGDILLEPFDETELVEAVERVARHRALYQENDSYSSRLEKINKELRESLDILKMDQIAGRQVQKNLLPLEPLVFKDYIVDHEIIPSLYLSGDFVAYNLVFDRYILFYIADVSGHGASSAFVTILLRFILKRILRRHMISNDIKALARAPEGFIEHVNRQVMATGLEKQVAMFAGAIDTDTNILRYSVAAQVPMPLFITEDGARFLPGKGKIIGLFEDATWPVEEMVLPDKFRLVMVSDGLLETLPVNGLHAQERYLQETLAATPANHQAMCRALALDKVTEAADDVSILTICRGSSV